MSDSRPFDIFVSHASEDKDAFVRPLATELEVQGLAVWYDEFALSLGDRLGESIDRGLACCHFGVVVLSPRFFTKRWPKSELYSLITRENTLGESLILPVWHEISAEEVARQSPFLAERVAVQSSDGLGAVVSAIVRKVRPDLLPDLHGRELRVAIAVVVRGGRFLLVRRCRPEGPLNWQFPAGAVKAWERDRDAAVREALAETGVHCAVVKKIGERVHPETATRLTYWLCRYCDGEARVLDLDENMEVRWLDGQEAIKRITSNIYPPLRALLHEAPESVRFVEAGGADVEIVDA